jgi:hypothetical protein
VQPVVRDRPFDKIKKYSTEIPVNCTCKKKTRKKKKNYMTYILTRGRYPIVCTVGVVVSPIGYYYREPVYFKCTKTFYGVLFLPVYTYMYV